MPEANVIICDGCNRIKQESNRWWLMVIRNDMLQLQKLDTVAKRNIRKGALFLCGRSCVTEAVSRYLERDHV